MDWDLLSLPNVDENLLWNPDLLILGTQTYNPHPETGMISVIDAYELVRRWNAKECYLVQYSGLLGFKESKNEWFNVIIYPSITIAVHHKAHTASKGKISVHQVAVIPEATW
jgi:hypothetical protein